MPAISPSVLPPSPQLNRIGEAADILAVSRRTIWRLIASGELASVRIGRSVRIPREAIENLVATKTEGR